MTNALTSSSIVDRIVPAGGVALLLVIAGWVTQFALQGTTALRASWPVEADLYYLPSPNTLRLASLGHRELAADLVAARGNVYFGTQITNKGLQRHLSKYINTVVDLDPYFHRVYLAGGAMVVYDGRTINADAVLMATAILERGTKVFPFDWQMAFQYGFNLLFELPTLVGKDDPRLAGWRQRGVEALQKAALFEGTPSWLPNLVARMLTKRGSDELAIKHLEQAYTVATSEEARHQIRSKLATLKATHLSVQFEEDRRRFDDMVKTRYPYAPDAFSVIMGPRHGRAVVLEAGAPSRP